MTQRRWHDLSPTTRRVLIAAGGLDALLRIAALIDLAHRPAHEVRGSKRTWAVAIAVVNSAGLLPAAYLLRGRHRPAAAS